MSVHARFSGLVAGAAALAAHLETVPETAAARELLIEEEPALFDLRTFSREQAPSLTRMWEGEELFRTTTFRSKDGDVFRAFLPFHRDGAMRIAQIDLDAGAADFLQEQDARDDD